MRDAIRDCVCIAMLVVVACSEGASEVSSIDYARVLAVRVEVDADPTRATPRFDEAAHARVLVSGPEGAVAVHYAMSLCVAGPVNGTLPTCTGATLAAVMPDTPSESPVLTWSGLSTPEIGDAEALLIVGTVCEQGVPATDVSQPGLCVAPRSAGVSFVGAVTLLDDAATRLNHHPSLAAASARFDDAQWPTSDCIHVARDGKPHSVSISLRDANRESVEGEPETLQLSWFTSIGALDRHYTVLESDVLEDTPLTVTWTAPRSTDATDNGTAHITIVLRDQRGGVDWTERLICLD